MTWTLENQSTVQDTATATTSATVSFGFTATAGRLLVMLVTVDKSSGGITAPSGWVATTIDSDNASVSLGFMYKIAAGGETTATATLGTSEQYTGIVVEYSSTSTPSLDGNSAGNYDNGTVTQIDTGTASSLTSGDVQLAIAGFGNDTGLGQTLTSYGSGYSNVDFDFTASGGGAPGLAIADDQDFSGTSTSCLLTVSGNADQMVGGVLVFKHAAAAGGIEILRRRISGV